MALDHDKVETDDGGEVIWGAFKRVGARHRIKYEMTTEPPQFNGVAEYCLGMIESASFAALI